MADKISEKDFDPKKHIQEYKRKCNECGKVWHSLVAREKTIEAEKKNSGCVGVLTACGGNQGAATQSIRNAQAQEDILSKLKICPQCGSANYTEQIITFEKK